MHKNVEYIISLIRAINKNIENIQLELGKQQRDLTTIKTNALGMNTEYDQKLEEAYKLLNLIEPGPEDQQGYLEQVKEIIERLQ